MPWIQARDVHMLENDSNPSYIPSPLEFAFLMGPQVMLLMAWIHLRIIIPLIVFLFWALVHFHFCAFQLSIIMPVCAVLAILQQWTI